MKSKRGMTVNSVLKLSVFMVLCTGIASPKIAFAASAPTESFSKAQLHLPWNLLSERLRVIANNHSSAVRDPIKNQLIEAEGLNWNVSTGSISSNVSINQSSVNESQVAISGAQAKISVVIDQLTLDQVIERQIGGVNVRVHMNAVCGPISITQANASASAVFSLSWQSGSPEANLASLDVGWEPESWSINDFTCSGPSGLDQQLKDGIANYLKDPQALKPFIETYIDENLKTSVDAVLERLREPLAIGSGASAVAMFVGELQPVETGIIADLTLTRSDKNLAAQTQSKRLPVSRVLASLSTSQPSFVGDIGVIEFGIARSLSLKPKYYRIDLQTVEAFASLMKSRLKQFFGWHDLTNYPKNSPFYLNIANPRTLSLSRVSGSNSLSSRIPLSTVMQSYREQTWWNYVMTNGEAATSVALSVSGGKLKYTTSISNVEISSAYGADYKKRFKKTSSIPDGTIARALAGPQPALSGELAIPNVDLGEAGLYRAGSFKWIDAETFSVSFSTLR